jgi:hypothetical protein
MKQTEFEGLTVGGTLQLWNAVMSPSSDRAASSSAVRFERMFTVEAVARAKVTRCCEASTNTQII